VHQYNQRKRLDDDMANCTKQEKQTRKPSSRKVTFATAVRVWSPYSEEIYGKSRICEFLLLVIVTGWTVPYYLQFVRTFRV